MPLDNITRTCLTLQDKHYPQYLLCLKMPTIEYNEHSISPLNTSTLFTVLPLFRLVDTLASLGSHPVI